VRTLSKVSTTEHDIESSKLEKLDAADAVDGVDLDLDAVTDVDVADDVPPEGDSVTDEALTDVDDVESDAESDVKPDAESDVEPDVEPDIEAGVDTDVEGDRLGDFDEFLADAQAEHADDLLDDSDAYELPAIVMATEVLDEEAADGAEALRSDELEITEAPVSDDLLEELRRADIDGPSVPMVPSDDSSSGIRRAVRSPDYDPAPMPIPLDVPRILGRKPRVRKVTRVVRHVDPWSVFKIALVANLLIYFILLVAGVLLWNVANATGTVDNVQRFLESFGWASFQFNGGQLFHSAWTGGLFIVIGFTGLAVLLATMFNLITDLVGGMRFTVLEEEVVETRTSPMRRFVVRRAEPEVPFVTHDESGPVERVAVVDDSNSR
jgi:hypothetical protein